MRADDGTGCRPDIKTCTSQSMQTELVVVDGLSQQEETKEEHEDALERLSRGETPGAGLRGNQAAGANEIERLKVDLCVWLWFSRIATDVHLGWKPRKVWLKQRKTSKSKPRVFPSWRSRCVYTDHHAVDCTILTHSRLNSTKPKLLKLASWKINWTSKLFLGPKIASDLYTQIPTYCR